MVEEKGELKRGGVIFGVGLGFLLSYFMGWTYGMPAGILMELGLGMILEQAIASRHKK